jgi:hypothetical protein
LLSFGPTLTFRHYTSLPTYDLFDLSPGQLSAVVANPTTSTFVLVDEGNIQDQWLNQAPPDNLLRLRASPGLTALATYGPYTLFRVASG